MNNITTDGQSGKEKLIIYQLFPRIMTNTNPGCVANGSFEQNGCGKLRDFTPHVLDSIKNMGVNCIWLTGIIEMATKTSFPGIDADNPNIVKGEAGSPYAIKDYYDIAPSLAVNVKRRMQEFEELVKRIHQAGMKVIIDFVPNHTARVYHSDVAPKDIKDFGTDDDISMFFRPDNNYYYITNQQFAPDFDIDSQGNVPYREFPAKATGNDCFTAFCHQTDWYETVKLNYGYDPDMHQGYFSPAPDTWLKMLHILRFWASKGVDGFRCDMVFMVPQEFWHWAIPQVKKDYSDIIFIGEIYDVGLYRPFLEYCHFDYLYDKVNLYDTLVGIERNHYSAARLTSCWQTVDGLGDQMLNFLENHDEVRFASKSFSGNPVKVVPYLVASACISTGPFMIYYGQELGEPGADNEGFAGYNDRTTIFDYWSMETMRRWYNNGKCDDENLTAHERWLRDLYKRVLTMCNDLTAIREGKFFDLMYVNLQNPDFNPHSLFTFIRYCEDQALLFLLNFSDQPLTAKINIPEVCFDLANLSEGEFYENELLWSRPYVFSLARGGQVCLSVNGKDALILPLRGKLSD